MRLAAASDLIKRTEPFEILSLNGTISFHGVHLHLGVADQSGCTFGGHLMEENLIYTTCELVIVELKEVEFFREFDSETGFKELKII